MNFLIFWASSTIICFFLIALLFNIDHSFNEGRFRKELLVDAELSWATIVVPILIPMFNIIIFLIGVIGFLFNCHESRSLKDGVEKNEQMIKKIFFIGGKK